MAKTSRDEVRKFVSVYVTQLREVTCSLTGDDLKAMGLPPGPRYREIFDKVLSARLNGEVSTREDEFRLARKEFALA
jgi:tRNA nucleotidyltransferase (CCA-adding enzyme)